MYIKLQTLPRFLGFSNPFSVTINVNFDELQSKYCKGRGEIFIVSSALRWYYFIKIVDVLCVLLFVVQFMGPYSLICLHIDGVCKILTHCGLVDTICYWTFCSTLVQVPLTTIGHSWLNINEIFSCDQAAIWLVQSVCLSVCPSVRPSVTPFSPCSHHRIIMKFSGVITDDKCDVHAKGQCQRSKVKVTEVNIQLNRFRTVTPDWIHICWWNDAYSLMMLRRGALLFFKVVHQISRSHGSKKRQIWPRLGVSGL